MKLSLRFPSDEQERAFQAYHTERVFPWARLTFFLAILAYAAYGVFDFNAATESGALRATRFRYLIACPILILFFALTYMERIRKIWQPFTVSAVIVASAMVSVSVILLDMETDFTFASGNATIHFMVALTLVALFPLLFWPAALSGLIVQLVHASLLIAYDVFTPWFLAAYIFHLAMVFVVLCLIAYARERVLRTEFRNAVLLSEEKDLFKTHLLAFVSPKALEPSGEVRSVADAFGEVTVMFCDVVGFTALAERLAPKHLVELLNTVFSAFDELAERLGVEKVKTIGDAYMAIAGTKSDGSSDSAEAIADFALAILEDSERLTQTVGHPLAFRIGINTGYLIGGIVGRTKKVYDYWGRTVNVASRLESGGTPGRIHVSEATFWRLRTKYDLEKRGAVDLKGIGIIETYYLLGRKRRPNQPAK